MSEAETIKAKRLGTGGILLVVSVLILLAGGAIAWWHIAHPAFSHYTAALDAIRTHELSPDAIGRVDLSQRFPGITARDYALVTWLDDGSFRALFPSYFGEGSQISGLMYTSRPLREDDTQLRTSSIHFDQRIIAVGSFSALILEERLNQNWYRVSYKLQ